MKVFIITLFLIPLLNVQLVASAFADTVVIVNAKNETTSLNSKAVRKLFLGKSRVLPDGSPALLVSVEAIQSDFNKRALRKRDAQVKAAWSRLVFSGRAQPPREFGTAAEAIAFIASNPSAIGYVSDENLTDEVKVVHRLR